MNVALFGKEKIPSVAQRLATKAAQQALGAKAKRRGELCLIFVSDAAIHKVNREFLGHDYPTDVLSFPYEALPGVKDPDAPFGDIYISVDTAKRQAKSMGHDVTTEILTLITHGALHLVGYDDKTPADQAKMFKRQDRLVQQLRKPRPYGKK
jgi:probable rRNA maturation factor